MLIKSFNNIIIHITHIPTHKIKEALEEMEKINDDFVASGIGDKKLFFRDLEGLLQFRLPKYEKNQDKR